MKKILNWIAFDGLLHMLVCAVIIFSFTPIVGLVSGALPIAVVIAVTKEYIDLTMKRSNNLKQVLHDLLCDAIGIIYATLILLIF